MAGIFNDPRGWYENKKRQIKKDYFNPRWEKLSENNYPELHKQVEILKAKISADYPNEKLPDAWISKPAKAASWLEHIMPNSFIQEIGTAAYYYMQYNLENPAEELNEMMVIHQYGIEKLPTHIVMSAIAHEYGHDIHNLQYDDTIEKKKYGECKADHFSAHYVDKKGMIELLRIGEQSLEELQQQRNDILDSDTWWKQKTLGQLDAAIAEATKLHPHPSDRIKALEDEDIVRLPVDDVEFNPDCTAKTHTTPKPQPVIAASL